MNTVRTLIKKKDLVLNFLIYLCLFLFALYPYRDYDWGWHMRQGEYFFTHGHIMYHDIYSWTMQGYTWINHEWLYDPLLFILYKTTSFWGLSVAGALVTIGTFYFCLKGIKLAPYKLAVCAFFFGYLTSGVIWQGLRSQIIGLLFIALTMYMLRLVSSGSKKPFIIFPFFFLLWANLHGTFTFGLVILGLFFIQRICIDSIKNGRMFIGKFEVFMSISFLLSIIMTLVNPFGIGVYLEALRHFSNPLLKYIGEWDPVEFPSTFYFLMIAYALVLITVIVLDYRRTKRINIYMIGIILFNSYLAWEARRYEAVAVTATLPFVAGSLSSLKINLGKYKTTYFLVILCIVISLEMAIFRRVLPWRIFQNYTISDYCSFGSKCSEGLTSYLIKHPPQGRGFSFYDWGGYLIGRGVPAKLFIDGRMHLWKNPDGYQPFWDYQQIYYENNTKLFDKYNFDWAILPGNASLNVLLRYGKVKGKWVTAYDDGDAALWVRERGTTQKGGNAE